jgi:hypothetical protein
MIGKRRGAGKIGTRRTESVRFPLFSHPPIPSRSLPDLFPILSRSLPHLQPVGSSFAFNEAEAG